MRRIFIGCTLIVALLMVLAGLGAASPDNSQEPKVHTTIHIRKPLATSGPTGLAPAQIRSAYNLPSTGGSGTIAIIDAYDYPTAQSDLNVFSSQFGLPAANFEKHMMASTVAADSGWALEESLDIQWAHAIAPGAKILLVEAKSSSLIDLLAAVDYARGRTDVIAVSMSWGAGEFSGETSYDSHFTSSNGATFFASSGDSGSGVIWPAASPNVVGVGGTTLVFSGSSLASETGWSGSGGGLSRYEAAPGFQTAYGILGANGKRAVPDVSYDADPNSGVSVYDSYVYGGWLEVGGTSAGAPQWAAIQSLGTSSANSNFYKDAKASYSSYFRDVISGSNGHPATTGYDLVTGLGSPLTVNFAPAAADFTVGASPASQSVAQGSSTSYSITIKPVNGFNNSVNLSLSGLPSGANGIFTPNPATGTASLSVTTSSSTSTGTYGLTVTGTSGVLTRTTNITLIVTASADFSLSATPASQSVVQGSSTSYSITINPLNGFNNAVNLSLSGLPNGASGIFTPNPATGTASLSVTTSSITSTGTYSLTVTGTSGVLTRTTNITLIVTASADFSLNATPASQSVVRGSSTSYSITINPLNGFNNGVNLSLSGLPNGASGIFTPNPTTGTASLSVTTSSSTSTGTYGLTVTGTNGVLTRTTTITLIVTASADFSLNATPASQSVVRGSSTSYSITINPLNGFNNGVNLSLSGLPNGASGTFTPNPATGTASLSVTTSSSTSTGTYSLTVTGTSGVLTRTTNITLIVTASSSFSLIASPSSTTISRGGSTTFNVTITPVGNFSGKVALSASGLPGQSTATFSPNPATNASTLTIRTSSFSPRGTYQITITGVSGTTTKITNVTLIIR